MKNILLISQIVLALVLTILILIQSRGTGIGRTFGGGSVTSFTRRGMEKAVFRFTFIVAGLFTIISLLELVL
jgi:preprotein translocase subunit SecG